MFAPETGKWVFELGTGKFEDGPLTRFGGVSALVRCFAGYFLLFFITLIIRRRSFVVYEQRVNHFVQALQESQLSPCEEIGS